MAAGETIAYAAAGLLASEAAGVTDLTSVGSGGNSGVPGGGNAGPAVDLSGLRAQVAGLQASVQAAAQSGGDASSVIPVPTGGDGGPPVLNLPDPSQSGVSADQVRSIVEATVERTQDAAGDASDAASDAADVNVDVEGTGIDPSQWFDSPDVPNPFDGTNGGDGSSGDGTGGDQQSRFRNGFNLQDLAGTGPLGTTVATVGETGVATASTVDDAVTGAGEIVGDPGNPSQSGGILGFSYDAGQVTGKGAQKAAELLGRDPAQTLPGGVQVPDLDGSGSSSGSGDYTVSTGSGSDGPQRSEEKAKESKSGQQDREKLETLRNLSF